MNHAGDITLKKTLCGLDTVNNKCGWIFTEENMKLSPGQMYGLFRDRVSCGSCLEIASKARLKETCDQCGKEL